MEFKNRENPSHKIGDKIIWESRSVAVNLVVLIVRNFYSDPYVLVSKRGPKAADYQDYYNLVAGYLDWDETGTDAVIRETWEEFGLNLPEIMKENTILRSNLEQPWHVKTDPASNQQNVSLRYGVKILTRKANLPLLNIENNEIEGEVEDPQWMPLSKISNYKWAFDHDLLIKEYIKFLKLN